jgi:hypothetical protein
MNDFQENIADTAERTLAERHIEAVREQGGLDPPPLEWSILKYGF